MVVNDLPEHLQHNMSWLIHSLNRQQLTYTYATMISTETNPIHSLHDTLSKTQKNTNDLFNYTCNIAMN